MVVLACWKCISSKLSDRLAITSRSIAMSQNASDDSSFRLVRGTGFVDPVLGSTVVAIKNNVLKRLYGILWDAEQLSTVTWDENTPTTSVRALNALYFEGSCAGKCGDLACSIKTKAHVYLTDHSKGPLGMLKVWIAGVHECGTEAEPPTDPSIFLDLSDSGMFNEANSMCRIRSRFRFTNEAAL